MCALSVHKSNVTIANPFAVKTIRCHAILAKSVLTFFVWKIPDVGIIATAICARAALAIIVVHFFALITLAIFSVALSWMWGRTWE